MHIGRGTIIGGAAVVSATVTAALIDGPLAAALAAFGAVGAWYATQAAGRHATADAVRRLADQAQRGGHLPDPAAWGTLSPLAEHVADLQLRLASATEAATTDKLTRVANRSTLLAALFEEVERASRYGRPLSIAFLDIDHFKQVNDTYGHDAGDVVLATLGRLLDTNLRQSDLAGRYGGEEFVIVFPETTVDESTSIAEKLRLAIAKERIAVEGGEQIAVTASIGLAGGHGQPLRVDDLLRDADAAMYAAKSLGRNQTYVFAEVDDDSARIPRAPITATARAAAAEVADRGRRAAEAALASVIMPLPHYRGKPSSLIAAIAVRMARDLDLGDAEVERIRVASLLHDIGKVGVPDDILEKPGPLTPDEWQTVVQHPRIGQEILHRVAAVKDAAAIILHHHERYSGHGYPHGLRGGDIPIGARIVAIADAYDAMLSDRPYRAAIGHDAAIAELRAEAGMQFDPELVELFCTTFAHEPPQSDPELLVTPVDLPAPMRKRQQRNRSASA